MGHLNCISSFQGSGTIVEEGLLKECKSQRWWITTKVFSRYNRTVSQMNSQQLRQQAQHLIMLKADQIPAWTGDMGTKCHSLFCICWQLLVAKRERAGFPKSVSSGK